MRTLEAFSSLVLTALTVSPLSVAHATYSIVAADARTMQVGGAGASCVYPNQVSVIYGVSPGKGAVHAQALSNAAGRDRAVQLLATGTSPAEIVTTITSASFDRMAARRQYGVVDLMGRSAGYTGTQNLAVANDRQGTVDDYVYSIQGNILTGEAVLEQAADSFEASGCDLAERLMLALEAGPKGEQGDSRCVDANGIGSNSAFIQVDLAGMPAGSYLKLSAGSGRGVDPLPALRAAFDVWRSSHQCMPRGTVDAGTGPGDADGGDAGASPRDAGSRADDASVGAVDAGGFDGSTIPEPETVPVNADPGADPGDRSEGGCSAARHGQAALPWWLGGLGVAVAARRRRGRRKR